VRRWPRTVFGIVLAAAVTWAMLDPVREPFAVAAYAAYHVAVATPPNRLLSMPVIGLLSASILAGLVLVGSPQEQPSWWTGRLQVLTLGVAVVGMLWAVGQAVRDRRASAARAAAEQAERAVTQERLRIARELHDSLAHSVGVIAIKAAVANHVAHLRPGEAHDALRVIETTSRGALAELRHMLGLLRATDGESLVELSPTPGEAELAALAHRVTDAGVAVHLNVQGLARLPDGVKLSVYRIVQEALTNVVKHAAPARCSVTVHASEQEVRIEVVDDGRQPAPSERAIPRGGHGLIGMRERVAMYGGRLFAAPRAEGGFLVAAQLPYEPTATDRGAP
jgi:signal transduction histidine kinase